LSQEARITIDLANGDRYTLSPVTKWLIDLDEPVGVLTPGHWELNAYGDGLLTRTLVVPEGICPKCGETIYDPSC